MASSLRVCRPFAQQAGRAPRAASWATRHPSCFMRASLRVGSARRYVCVLHVVSLVCWTGPAQYSISVLNLPCFWVFPSTEFFLHPARWSLVYFSRFPCGAILFFFHSCPFPRFLLCPFSYLAFSSVVSNFFCSFIVLAVPYRLFPSSRLPALILSSVLHGHCCLLSPLPPLLPQGKAWKTRSSQPFNPVGSIFRET